jgi:hypothetical protein
MALPEYSDEVVSRLRDEYVTGNIALEELHLVCEEVCGQQISFESLRELSKAGQWEIARSLYVATGDADVPINVEEEAEVIRKLIFQRLVEGQIENMSNRDFASLSSAWNTVRGVGSLRTTSAKTDIQKILDARLKGEPEPE